MRKLILLVAVMFSVCDVYPEFHSGFSSLGYGNTLYEGLLIDGSGNGSYLRILYDSDGKPIRFDFMLIKNGKIDGGSGFHWKSGQGWTWKIGRIENHQRDNNTNQLENEIDVIYSNNIYIKNPSSLNLIVIIYDLSGKIYYKNKINNNKTISEENINGNFMVTIQNQLETITKKFIKEN